MKLRLFSFLCFAASMLVSVASPTSSFELRDGDRVAFIGDTLMEREQYSAYIELALASHFPDRQISFRNLGWSADTPRGNSRYSLSKLQAGNEPADEAWNLFQEQIALVKPTVVFLGYGMANSFDGAQGLTKFKTELQTLIDTIAQQGGATKVRFVLLSPIRHENLGAPLPDPTAHNAQLALYTKAIAEVAAQRGFPFISLFDDLKIADKTKANHPLTDNGIHLNERGYQRAANVIEKSLGFKETHFGSKRLEQARQEMIRKNQLFFERSRPQNMAYLLGFRKAEQGRNAAEIPKFDPLIASADEKIWSVLNPAAGRASSPLRAGREAIQPASKHANDGAQRTAAPHQISSPTNTQALPEFQMAPGFEATLWAENPLLAKPIQMNFDAQGRLWIASSAVYPQIEPGQIADDKIIVLEDTKGTGHADKSTVFVDGLLVPTAVIPGDDGVYVGQSTELLHFRDTNHDGKADERKIVLSSFGTEDSHHNIHTLRWAPDGQLYFDQSIYIRTDAETPHGVVRLKSGGVFNLRPQTLDLDIFLRGFCNPWGHAFDEFGQSFVTDGAGSQGINFGIRSATYFTYANMRREMKSISAGSYPKFCGLEMVHSEQFPPDWQGNLITSDFRAHRVVRFALTEQGAGFAAQELTELMRTTNVTFRPIDAKFGPDGALYVADWSNPIINHGEVDFRDPRRDHEHGRIWRITAKGRPLVKTENLTKASNKHLLDELLSPNEFNRMQAHRVLTERGRKIIGDLNKWTKQRETERNEKGLLEALWTYQSIGERNDTLLRENLNAKDGRIRAAATRVLSDHFRGPVEDQVSLLKTLVHDSHPRVRLEAVRALAKLPYPACAALVLEAVDQPMDSFLDYAVWLSINDLASVWVASVKNDSWKAEGREKQLEFALRAIDPQLAGEVMNEVFAANKPLPRDGSGPWIELLGSMGNAKQIAQLANQACNNGFTGPATERAVAALTRAARERNVKPASEPDNFPNLLAASSDEAGAAVLRLAGLWKVTGWRQLILQNAAITDQPASQTAAFEALAELGVDGATGQKVLNGLRELTAARDAKTRREAAVTLARLDFDGSVTNILTVLTGAKSEEDAAKIWKSLLAIKNAGSKLARALPKTDLSAAVARAGLKVAREDGKNESDLILAITRSANLDEKDKTLTPAEIKHLADSVSAGDPVLGEKLFRNPMLACVNCHAIGGAGGKVGPDLTSIGASAPVDYLIEAVLYPNAKIKEGYHTIILSTKDEQEYSGIVQRETETEIVVRDSTGKDVTLPKSTIQSRKNGGSLMPSGLVDNLTSQERTALFRFLSELGKPGPYDASKGNVVRTWKLLVSASTEANTVDPILKGDLGNQKWEPIYTTVSGDLLRETLEPRLKELASQSGVYTVTKLQVAREADISFQLTAGKKSELYVDGSVVASADAKKHLAQGKHSVVIKLSPKELPDKVRLQISDGTFVND